MSKEVALAKSQSSGAPPVIREERLLESLKTAERPSSMLDLELMMTLLFKKPMLVSLLRPALKS